MWSGYYIDKNGKPIKVIESRNQNTAIMVTAYKARINNSKEYKVIHNDGTQIIFK